MKKYLVRYPIASFLSIFIFVALVLCVVFKIPVQFGGILDKIWGKNRNVDNDVRFTPPKKRVDDKGNPIPVEKPDEDGWVQEQELKIVDPGIFSDPDIITVIHPVKGEIDVKLPKGVKNKDVEKVVIVAPNVLEIKNNDKITDNSNILDKIRSKDKA